MASEGKSEKELEKSMKELNIEVTSSGNDVNTCDSKDGNKLDAASSPSSGGDAVCSNRGSEGHQEATVAEQNTYYPARGGYGYYYPGFDGSMGDWAGNGYYGGAEGFQTQHYATQPENESLAYSYPAYQPGYSPYGHICPVTGADGRYYAHQPYQHHTPLFQQYLASSGYIPHQPLAYGSEFAPTYWWNSSSLPAAGHRINEYSRYPSESDHRPPNHAIVRSKTSAPLSSAPSIGQSVNASNNASQSTSAPNQDLNSTQKMNDEASKGLLRRPAADNVKSQKPADNVKSQKPANWAHGGGDLGIRSEHIRGSKTNGSKGVLISGNDSTAGSVVEYENGIRAAPVKKEYYNLVDFPTKYSNALFFVIKSYSEDDVHKSIKYNVWSSTTSGNKRLDNAYRVAQAKAAERGSKCPVFLFFSVNASGQFCGVAEMIGRVDFNKTMDFWQQDKWNGYFPVKWHIIKDTPNLQFRHIILENNENKSVTSSRDTQEVKFTEGTQMLNIFKNFSMKTSILDDFDFYETRQKELQEKRTSNAGGRRGRSGNLTIRPFNHRN